jgi:hypothetical protein
MPSQHAVLFLAARPSDTAALRLDVECREIGDAIRGARYQDRITFTSRWAVRPADLLQALNELSPEVLHFSGHGDADGLSFENDRGLSHPVSAEVLAQVVAAAGRSLRLVVLNACYSQPQAEALAAHVPCVVGSGDEISDQDATRYAAAFYRSLAFGHSVKNAHDQGLAAIALEAGTAPDQTRLVCRPGVDPDQLRLIGPDEPPAAAPWWRHPAAMIAAALALMIGGVVLYRWLTEEPAGSSTVFQSGGDGTININGSPGTEVHPAHP